MFGSSPLWCDVSEEERRKCQNPAAVLTGRKRCRARGERDLPFPRDLSNPTRKVGHALAVPVICAHEHLESRRTEGTAPTCRDGRVDLVT